jgi:hypothetical protein
MILKRVEKEGVVKAIYKSSHILASSYNTVNNALTVTFDRGAQYTYEGVSQTDYTRFEIAESQGKVLNSHIKNKYEVSKGDNIDTARILAEIDNINAEELKELEGSVVKSMDALLKGYAKNETFDKKGLTDLQFLISKLQKDSNE